MKKFGLRLTSRRKWYFVIFAFSLYPNFKWLLSKTLWCILRILSNFCYVTNIFDLHIYDNETTAHLIFFKFVWICILFLYFFQNERNITTTILIIHLKCTVLHYANLKSSSKNKLLLNYGSLNMLLCFFRLLIYLYVN